MKILYKIGANSDILEWRIWCEADSIIVEYGKKGGKFQRVSERIAEGKAGRSIDAQISLRIMSKLRRQYDLGYRDSIDEAMESKGKNTLNLVAPMLAKKISDVNVSSFDGSYVQRKYNGHRCLITRVGDELIAYSRNGRYITTIDHILESIDIPEGITIDGELYCHGERLQTIASWTKRKQANTSKLSYIVYDTVMNAQFEDRFNELINYRFSGSVELAQTIEFDGSQNIVDEFISEGYEGAIVRLPGYEYQAGKRSSSLLKIKAKFDDEFRVVDIVESKDGWGILVCECKPGVTFRVSAPGTVEDKKNILDMREYYIGRMVQVEYYDTTKAGKPFHPVALQWRNKDEE